MEVITDIEVLENRRPWQLKRTRVGKFLVSTVDRKVCPTSVNEAGGYDPRNGRYETALYHYDESDEEPVSIAFSDSRSSALRGHDLMVIERDRGVTA